MLLLPPLIWCFFFFPSAFFRCVKVCNETCCVGSAECNYWVVLKCIFPIFSPCFLMICWFTFLHQIAAFCPHFFMCYCYPFFLPVLHHNNRSVMRWAKLNWGPDVVGLSVGSQQQPFPLGELPGVGGGGVGIRPVYSPPIINTAGKPTPHCYCCLLLFILCPCLLPHV